MEIEYGEKITNFPFLFYGRGVGVRFALEGQEWYSGESTG